MFLCSISPVLLQNLRFKFTTSSQIGPSTRCYNKGEYVMFRIFLNIKIITCTSYSWDLSGIDVGCWYYSHPKSPCILVGLPSVVIFSFRLSGLSHKINCGHPNWVWSWCSWLHLIRHYGYAMLKSTLNSSLRLIRHMLNLSLQLIRTSRLGQIKTLQWLAMLKATLNSSLQLIRTNRLWRMKMYPTDLLC